MSTKRERYCLQSRVLKHFEQVAEGSHLYKCLIDTGKCIKPLNGRVRQNLVAHARTHTEFFRQNFEIDTAKQRDMPARRLEFIQHCTEIVTVNKQPFAALNWSGMRKLNQKTIKALSDAGCATGLNPPKCRAIKSHIGYLASEIIAQIKSEVEGKFVSLMVDTAKKFHRSILGINVQFMLGSHIAIRSIGMIHLTSSHSAIHIAKTIHERMEMFGMKNEQLISITTDNASNMTAMIERFNEAYNEDAAGNESSDSEFEDSNVASAVSNANEAIPQTSYSSKNEEELKGILRDVVQQMELEDSDDLFELLQVHPDLNVLLRDLEEIFAGETLNINSIRCAAHTLQLAIMDALGINEFDLLIRLARAVCKELRKDCNINELRQNNIRFKIPRIDCKTRWNSIYIMLLDMISRCKEAIIYFAEKPKAQACFGLVLFQWQVLEEILKALKIPFEVTNAVQNATFTLSDFYGSWLKMERRLNQLVTEDSLCKFAEKLIEMVEKRKKSLLNNQALISAVYLDPRFNFRLTQEEKQIAKLTLENVFERVKRFKESSSQSDPATQNDIDDSFERDCVASGMAQAFHRGSTMEMADRTFLAPNLSDLFESFEKCDRLHNRDSILEFWRDRRTEDPVLYELAAIVHAIPPTQATVERAFSALASVCNNKTSRLSNTSLENILMIVLNKDLVDPINERDMDALTTNAI